MMEFGHGDYQTHVRKVTQSPLTDVRNRLQAKGEWRRVAAEKKMTMCLMKSMWKIRMLEMRGVVFEYQTNGNKGRAGKSKRRRFAKKKKKTEETSRNLS